MRVCLVNPSLINETSDASPLSTRNRYFMNPYNLPHIGLGYIAAYLNKNGYQTDIIECARLDISANEVCERIYEGKYDIIGISAYYFNFKNTLKIINGIKKKNSSAFVFLGGYLPTLSYELLLNSFDNFDCCVIGEGEFTALELVEKLDKGEDWKNIPGIAYKQNNEIIFTGKRDLIEDLDILPFPEKPFISERKIVSVLTARGCYGNCTYCGIQEFFNKCNGRKVRRRSPENVVEEIEYLIERYGVKYVSFNDGNFHVASKPGNEWFERFYQLIKEKNINVKFLVDFRANEIVKSRHIIEKFLEIGLYNVNVGIESLLQKQLDFFNKQVKVEDNINAIRILEEYKVKYTYGILIFDPIIKISEVLEFLNKVKEIGLYNDDYNISPPLSIACTVVATEGTPIHKYVVENGLLAQNDINYRFKDEKTARCHEIVAKWRKVVTPIYNKNYISYIAQDNNKTEELSIVKKMYQSLFLIDLEFFIEACREITDNYADMQQLTNILKKWEVHTVSIMEKLTEIEGVLREYY